MSEQEMRDVARDTGRTVERAFAALTDRIALRWTAQPEEMAA